MSNAAKTEINRWFSAYLAAFAGIAAYWAYTTRDWKEGFEWLPLLIPASFIGAAVIGVTVAVLAKTFGRIGKKEQVKFFHLIFLACSIFFNLFWFGF